MNQEQHNAFSQWLFQQEDCTYCKIKKKANMGRNEFFSYIKDNFSNFEHLTTAPITLDDTDRTATADIYTITFPNGIQGQLSFWNVNPKTVIFEIPIGNNIDEDVVANGDGGRKKKSLKKLRRKKSTKKSKKKTSRKKFIKKVL